MAEKSNRFVSLDKSIDNKNIRSKTRRDVSLLTESECQKMKREKSWIYHQTS